MEFKKDLEQIKQDVDGATETQNDNNLPATSNNNAPTSFEDAKNQALAEFKPKYDTSKTMYENGKDIARTIGINEALKDGEFLNEMKEGAKENIRTDIDTDQMNADIEKQNAYYKKHKPVLSFARMKEPCDLSLMRWTYAFAVVPYIISLVIGGFFNLIGKFFECINELFNAIVGTPEYLINSTTGELVLDDKGNPIPKTVRVNLLTKIIFWLCFVMLCLVILFAIVKGVTGFDIISAIKNLIHG